MESPSDPLPTVRLRAGRADAGNADDAARILLVHGFTQNARCWAPFDEEVDDLGAVDAVDLPGHGDAPIPRTDLWAAASSLGAVGEARLHIGYSLGGRVLLHAALLEDSPVKRLVVIGAHPGLESSSERRTRRDDDKRRAERLESIGLAAFLDEWLALPLFGGLDPERAHREERLRNDPAGLAASLRLHGTGSQDPLWSRLAEIDQPALVLAGEHDDRFGAVGARLADAIGPNATFAVVSDTHHACPTEDPVATAAIIDRWFRKT